MAQLPENLRRPLYIYDLPPEILETLAWKTDATEQDLPLANTTDDTATPPVQNDSVAGSQACSLCALSFVTLQDQRGHLKSDLHHYNLKQKLRGLKPVSEAEFEKLIGDLDESLSGSDSSESEDDDDNDDASRKDSKLVSLLKKQATLAEKNGAGAGAGDYGGGDGDGLRRKKRGTGKPPLIWLSSSALPENHYFGVYRAIFSSEEQEKDGEVVEAIRSRQLAPIAIPKPAKDGTLASAAYKGPHIFLCMIGGGHFAAMVVSLAPRQTKSGAAGPLNREATVLAHKTFHRYTTRRKQGGSQSANDASKGAAHSAGSSLRRYNEQALTEDVRDLLVDWKGLLDTSDLLFIRATGTTNRKTLFGPYDDQILKANDPRIRGFPFSTRRATQNELMRSFIELTRLKVREVQPATAETDPAAKAEASTTKPQKAAAPKLSEEEETAQLHTAQLQALIRRSKVPALLSYLKTNSLPADFRFQPAEANHHAPTPLHLAASQNSAPAVTGLLARAGADPAVRSPEGRTAFELAGDRPTRDAFRVARHELGEGARAWDAAKVPPAMARAEADRRAERERKEAEAREAERKRAEEERVRAEGPRVDDKASAAAAAAARGGGKGFLAKAMEKTPQEKREEEMRGLTAEQRMKVERERRARAAEARMGLR